MRHFTDALFEEFENEEIKLYHLSKDKITELIPRIPESDFEDQETPRICFAKDIQGCLIGINEDADITGETFNVYSITTADYYEPTEEEVADVAITGEVWVLKPVKPIFEYKIKVTGKKDSYIAELNGDEVEVPVWDYIIVEPLTEEINYKGISDLGHYKKSAKEILGGYGSQSDNSIIDNTKEIYIDGKLVGYISFDEYDDVEGYNKVLGFGNFMILERGKGYGTKVIKDLVDRYKNEFDLIYCFVDAENLGAINLYKKLGKVYDEDGPNDNGQYYVTFWDKNKD